MGALSGSDTTGGHTRTKVSLCPLSSINLTSTSLRQWEEAGAASGDRSQGLDLGKYTLLRVVGVEAERDRVTDMYICISKTETMLSSHRSERERKRKKNRKRDEPLKLKSYHPHTRETERERERERER